MLERFFRIWDRIGDVVITLCCAIAAGAWYARAQEGVHGSYQTNMALAAVCAVAAVGWLIRVITKRAKKR